MAKSAPRMINFFNVMKCTKTWQRLVAVLISVILLSLGWLGHSGIGLLVALIPLLIISES